MKCPKLLIQEVDHGEDVSGALVGIRKEKSCAGPARAGVEVMVGIRGNMLDREWWKEGRSEGIGRHAGLLCGRRERRRKRDAEEKPGGEGGSGSIEGGTSQAAHCIQ